MKIRYMAFYAAVVMGCGAASALETAGELIVNLDMSTLSGKADGEYIGVWENQADGDLAVADFLPCTSGKGAVYVANAGGCPGVYFNGTVDATMESASTPPSTICGGDTWSVEAWIYTPTLLSSKTYFSWTRRGGANQLIEMRYGNDNGNGVEHHSNNVGWNGIPAAGEWHYVCITRNSSGTENLYVDGSRQNGKDNYTALNIRDNGTFTLGGVKSDGGGFDGGLLYTGYVGMIRVHSDDLTAEQVKSNYKAEYLGYQHAWKGGTGLWSDATQWGCGQVPIDNGVAVFMNGGTATLSGGSVALSQLNVCDGAVTVDGGATLAINAGGNINLAKLASATGTVWIKNGTFAPNRRVDGAVSGGNLVLKFGESGAAAGTAKATFPNELLVAANGYGELILEDGADITCRSWTSAGRSSASASGKIIVNGGQLTCNDWLLVGCDNGSGDLVLNGGKVLANGIEFTYNGSNAAQYGNIHLNGGVLEFNYTQNNNPTGTQNIYFNGGTMKARSTNGNFIINKFDLCEVQEGGAIFDVPGVLAVDVANRFTASTSSPGGKIVKVGSGRLNFKDGFDFDGSIDVLEGTVKFTQVSNLLNVETINVAEGAAVMCSAAGGAQELLSRIPADCRGTVLITAEDANSDIDLSGHPNIEIGFASVFTYNGTITRAEGTESTISYFASTGNIDVNQQLADIGGKPTKLIARGVAHDTGHKVVLKSDNTFTGGILVDGVMLQSDTAQGFGTTGWITLTNEASLVLNHANIDVQGLINRITPDSVGFLVFCSSSKKDVNFSLAGHPGLYVGAYSGHNFDYSGTITPDDPSEYHFGGGAAPYTQNDGGFKYKPSATPINDVDGSTPTKIVFNGTGICGLVNGSTANGFTGGVIVSNNATIFHYADHDAAYGVPAQVDDDYYYFDNGNIRFGGSNASLAANKGMTIGPGGMKTHVWGSTVHTVLGSLHGSGPITITDTGTLAFAGAANDYTGVVTVSNNARLQIGNDDNFSWDFEHSVPVIVQNGYLILHIPAGRNVALDQKVGGGNGYFWKQGAGTLEITVPQGTVSTRIAAGTLVVDGDDYIGTSGLTMVAGSTLEIRNGATLHLDTLNGEGMITAPEGTTATIVLGAKNGSGSFTGTIADNVRIVKEGTGRAEIFLNSARDEVTVNNGTLVLSLAGPIGRPTVAEGAVLELTVPQRGIPGKFYDCRGDSLRSSYESVINSLEEMQKFEMENEPGAVQYSVDFGDGFNVRGSGDANPFPASFRNIDYWLAIWRGYIWIEEAGTYVFSSASDDGSTVYIDNEQIVSNMGKRAWSESQFEETANAVELAKGWHPIVIGFFDSTSGNEMTIRITPPNGTAATLPNSMLHEMMSDGEVSVLDGSAVAGTVRITGSSMFVYDVDAGQTESNLFRAQIGDERAEIRKVGEGELVWNFRGEDAVGLFTVAEGTLTLDSATSVGTLAVDEGATLALAAKKNHDYRGLSIRYYDSSDNSYGELETQERMHTFFETTLTPTIYTNSYTFGSEAFNTDGNPAYREPGKYSTGQDNYYVYATGQIYLPYDGQYAFGFWSDDGIALYIDGQRYYLQKGTCGSAGGNNTGWQTFTRGYHQFEWAFRENGGGQFFYTYIWAREKDGVYFDQWNEWTLLPQSILYPEFSRVAGLSGAGTLALGAGMLVDEEAGEATFAGAVTASSTGYFVKRGEGTLALTGDLAGCAGGLVAGSGSLVIAPEVETLAYPGSLVVEADGTLCVIGDFAMTCGGVLRGEGTFVVDGAAVEIDAAEFLGEVIVRNGGSFVDRVSGGASECRAYRVTTSDGGRAALSKTAEGSAYADLSFAGGDGAVGGVPAFVTGADSLTLLDGADATLAGFLGRSEIADYDLWQLNGVAERYVGIDGAKGFVVINGAGNMTGSAYLKEPQDVTGPWRATWKFRATKGGGSAWGDGVAFVIQNDAAGAGLCDANCNGGKLGGPCDATHPLSAAFWWNLYQKESCGWAVAGVKGAETTLLNNPSNEARRTNQGYDVEVSHNGNGILLCVIRYQGEVVYTASRQIDFAAVIGGGDDGWDGKAYVGFSAASGGSSAFMTVTDVNWYVPSGEESAPSVSVESAATAELADFTGADEVGSLGFGSGSALTLKAAATVPENSDYVFTADELSADGAATLTLQGNGTGSGKLRVGALKAAGGAVSVIGGSVEAVDGEIEIIIPETAPDGRIDLMNFANSAWVGGEPSLTVVGEKETDTRHLKYHAFFRGDKIYVSNASGTMFFFR